MFGRLAQSVEHLTFNQVVGGSIPPSLIKKSQHLEESGAEAFFVVKGSAVRSQDKKKKPKERDSVLYLICLFEHSDLLICTVLTL